MAQRREDEGVDFSNFFKQRQQQKQRAAASNAGSQPKNSQSQSAAKKYTAILFSVASLGVASYLFYGYYSQSTAPASYEPPEGYRISTSAKEPPKLERAN